MKDEVEFSRLRYVFFLRYDVIKRILYRCFLSNLLREGRDLLLKFSMKSRFFELQKEKCRGDGEEGRRNIVCRTAMRDARALYKIVCSKSPELGIVAF